MIWGLLLTYQLKHFIADYPLQNTYMLGKFKPFPECIPPLTTHAAVHGFFTLFIVLCINPALAWLAIVDMVVHGTMDYVKANPSLLGQFKALSAAEYRGNAEMANWVRSNNQEIDRAGRDARERLGSNKLFWWALGFDQMVHHLTHYFIIWVLVS